MNLEALLWSANGQSITSGKRNPRQVDPMSFDHQLWVEAQSPYTGDALMIHHVLARAADDELMEVWFTAEDLAQRCRCSVRTVHRTRTQMVKDGLLEVLKDAVRGRPTVYRLVIPKVEQPGDAVTPVSPQLDGTGDTRVTPIQTVGVTSETVGVTSETLWGDKCDIPTVTQNPRKPLTTKPIRDIDGFDDFWALYPKRDGRRRGKPAATALWAKLSTADREAAMRGVPIYASECGNYAKDPERWIRHRCWEDYQESATVPLNGHRSNGHGRPGEALLLKKLEDTHGGNP